MQALKITAELMTGFASSDPWSPAIDGILAYQFMREKLGDEEFAIRSHRMDLQEPVTGLPLGVEQHGDQWWYQCSFPEYTSVAEITRHTHRRFDARQAEKYWGTPGKSGKVLVAAGPYKNARLKLRQHVTPAVTWYCIGDQAEIERLLARVTHVGARVGAGYGRVRKWTVEPAECETLARFRRGLPVEFAQAHQLEGQEMIHGIRPPVRHPDNKTLCVMVAHG
jgi:CRISPR type IV-associated protein Csf3